MIGVEYRRIRSCCLVWCTGREDPLPLAEAGVYVAGVEVGLIRKGIVPRRGLMRERPG